MNWFADQEKLDFCWSVIGNLIKMEGIIKKEGYVKIQKENLV